MSFVETVGRARQLLEENRRLSLRALKREFALDDDALAELAEELVDVQRVAAREGNVLAWIEAGERTSESYAPVEPEREGPAAERRQLTVMFCDLVGSTELSSRLDPEEWQEVLRRYQEAAAAVIAPFGGHVAQLLGDGLLVYFGWPEAHDDDAERAVRAGLALVDTLKELTDLPVPLAVRIGIHTGPVVVGQVGGGGHRETLALGETTNLAARLQGVAVPDTVVVSEATLRLVAGIFVTEDLGPQRLKGIPALVRAYRAVQPTGVRSRLDVDPVRLTRFVGREMELGTLVDRWERTVEGEGQAVLILAEPGVGKSRLSYQLRERLVGVAHGWLESRATPYTAGTPFHPVIELVRQALAIVPEEKDEEKIQKIERAVTLVRLGAEEAVPLIADLLGLPAPAGHPPLAMSPELKRQRTLELLTAWTLALAEVQPLVLLAEDLHWNDPSSLEVFGRLIAQSARTHLLIVGTARPEFTPPWPARSNLTTLPLTRLTKRQAREMVGTLGSGLPPDMVEALVARADGVPLYLEELAKAVIEPGVAREVEAIPATLADSLMARLDRLSTAKEVAQRASVLGREFSYALLAAVAGMEEAGLRHGLARLAEAEILFARGEPPDATYTFKHALIQETAYQSLLKRTRQQLHARTAELLEERFPERVASEPERVARHYEQAGLIVQAIGHYQRAGESATRRSANEEAISHLRHALDLVATLPETRERDEQELGLQMAIGVPLNAARGWSHPENEQAYARARELASRIGESPELPRVLAALALAYSMKADLATAAELAQQALAAAERTGEAFDLLSAHYQIGQPLFYQGHFSEALHHFEQSIRLYDPSAHASFAYTVGTDNGLLAYSFSAWCHVYLGHFDRALALGEEAVTRAQGGQHPLTLATTLFFAGLMTLERGEFDRAQGRADELIALAKQLGFPFWLGLGTWMRGRARVESDEADAGIAEMQQALVELAGLGSGVGAPGLLARLAEGLRKVGRRDEALGVTGLGVARAEQQGQHYADADLHRLRAEILLDQDCNAAPEAEALFHQSLEIARRQENKMLELRAATSLARFWQRKGRRHEARELLAPVYAWFTEGFDTPYLIEANALLAELV